MLTRQISLVERSFYMYVHGQRLHGRRRSERNKRRRKNKRVYEEEKEEEAEEDEEKEGGRTGSVRIGRG